MQEQFLTVCDEIPSRSHHVRDINLTKKMYNLESYEIVDDPNEMYKAEQLDSYPLF